MSNEVISRLISELKPHPRNYNNHSDRQVDDLALSLKKFGQRKPIVTWRNMIVAGHGLTMAAQMAGWTSILTMPIPDDWDEATVLAYLAADNELARQADPDLAQLAAIAKELEGIDEELAKLAAGGDDALKALMATIEDEKPNGDTGPQIDKAEELRVKWDVELGQMWQLGDHRIICGDCTDRAVVERLMQGEKAILCHADPPYGMGKEKDGVANDNLYNLKLDEFQMDWWEAVRPSIVDNASIYIWGTAEDLWRLWYRHLQISERLTFRNEIVWDKGSAQGMLSDTHRMYPTGSERCIFFMLGEQGFGNNADNYWEGWEPIRAYLKEQRDLIGWDNARCKELAGHSPKSGCHWFDSSQWTFVTEDVYEAWRLAANGKAFQRDYDELKRDYDELKRDFYATRAYFDNTHDGMTDVWSFPRVTGDDRHEHATPKPVAMMERAIKSSSPVAAIVYEPFSGSGTTLIACENLSRKARAVEISPAYVAVAIQRWVDVTGKEPILL